MPPAGSSDRPPLGPLAREALEHITAATTPEEGIPRERAVDLLVEEGFAQADAVDVLDQLHDRGHLYAVEGELFVTDREDPE